MKATNLGLRFLLELGLLAALAYWGFRTNTGILRWIAGIGAPAITAVCWGIFFAPNAQRRLSDPTRLVLEFVLFGLAVVALWSAEQTGPALLFGAAVAINTGLMIVWQQRH